MGSSRYIVEVRFSVSPVNSPVSINLYSGRFVKALIFLCRGFSWARALYEAKTPVKPLLVTPLYTLSPSGFRYILDGGLRLEVGSKAMFNVVFSTGNPSAIDEVVSGSECLADVWGSRVRVAVDTVEVLPIENLSIGFTNPRKQLIKLVFHTPTILPTKLMAPPFDWFKKKVEEVRSLYVLYPSLGHICSYLSKLWRSTAGENICPGPSDEWADYLMGRLCEVVLAPIDLKISPRTVRYDEKRRVRGFTGYMIIKLGVNRKKITQRIDKLFALANKLGIGKSRTIGFGITTTKTLELKTAKNYKQ